MAKKVAVLIAEKIRSVELIASLSGKEGSGTFELSIDKGEINLSHLSVYRSMTPKALKSLANCLHEVANRGAEVLKKYKTK